jgi:hypothetical protein
MRAGAIRVTGFWSWTFALLAWGCGGGSDKPARFQDSTPQPAGSLALSAAPGVEIWYTAGRSARSAGGVMCTERGLEIRRGTQRIQVPLLYTGEPPTLTNDSTMRAVLWSDYGPLKSYLVDLRTGQPRPERERKPR